MTLPEPPAEHDEACAVDGEDLRGECPGLARLFGKRAPYHPIG